MAVHLWGPSGSSFESFSRFKGIVLVGAGVGLPSSLSVLRHLFHQQRCVCVSACVRVSVFVLHYLAARESQGWPAIRCLWVCVRHQEEPCGTVTPVQFCLRCRLVWHVLHDAGLAGLRARLFVSSSREAFLLLLLLSSRVRLLDRSCWHRAGKLGNVRRAHFVWTTRHVESLLWCWSKLRR